MAMAHAAHPWPPNWLKLSSRLCLLPCLLAAVCHVATAADAGAAGARRVPVAAEAAEAGLPRASGTNGTGTMNAGAGESALARGRRGWWASRTAQHGARPRGHGPVGRRPKNSCGHLCVRGMNARRIHSAVAAEEEL